MSDYKTYPGKKIFPVQSATGCMLKWNWSSVLLNSGTTSSCHRCNRFPIDPDNFENFHNIPEKIQAREKMIAGQWPGQGCEYCRDIEQAGGTSDRLMQLNRQHGLDKIPPELLIDSNATAVTPTTLEVWFNNTCNMTCVYCTPEYSSKWTNEINKFGEIRIDKFGVGNNEGKNPDYERMVAQLWQYLSSSDRSSMIRHFHILGGEPFLQKELDQCIDFWAKHPNPSLTINVISNLMIPHDLFVEKILKFQKLYQDQAILTLRLTASLDGWGPEEQYTRHGLDLDLWEQNFSYMFDKPWCQLSVNSCVSSLSIKNTAALVERINAWNQRAANPIDWSFELPTAHADSGLHPEVFGPMIFADDYKKVLSMMPDQHDFQKQSKLHFEGLAKQQEKSLLQPQKIQNLKNYLTELDRRRGTSWTRTFTWLDQI